jgi:hypothetical protein
MSTKRILINSPVINELTFDYLFSLTSEQREKFAPKELRAIKTAKKARQFVEKTTLDEKLLTLAKLGVGFSFILHNNNPLTARHIKEKYEKYKDMAKDKYLQEMTNEKFVVLTDRVLINFLNVLGNLSHSDMYLLNLDFHKIGQFIHQWKRFDRPDTNSIQEAIEYAKLINRFSLNVAIQVKKVKGVSEIADLDLLLLMYFYDLKAQYVRRETVEAHFGGIYKKTLIASALKRLVEKLLIDRNPIFSNIVEYQITSLGNSSVMNFHRKNLSQTV